jgi:hypothetical protein
MPEVRDKKSNLDSDDVRILNLVIQGIAACSCKEIQLIMFCVLEDQYLFYFIHFDNTIHFLLPIVAKGIEVRSEYDAIEKQV